MYLFEDDSIRARPNDITVDLPAKSVTGPILLKRGADATIPPMMDRYRTRLSRCVGTVLACIFAIVCMTSSICPVCLSQDLLSTQHTTGHGINQHQGPQDCDRDGCSCCGFQFIVTANQIVLDACELSAAPLPSSTLFPTDYPSGFYHPPRA
jgi:hypothetical protein